MKKLAILVLMLSLAFSGCATSNRDGNNNETVQHVIRYQSNGGGRISSIVVDDGATIEDLSTPTRVGYTFGGWYLDSSFTTLFEEDSVIKSDISLYAKWLGSNYAECIVTFTSNGGTNVESIKVAEGSNIALPANPTRQGYLFSGWYVDKELKTKFEEDANILDDSILYAKWVEEEKEAYIVSFNSNGGSGISTIRLNSGSTIVLPSNPTKTGYTFEGWYTESGLSNKFSVLTKITSNITLYAKWKENNDAMITRTVTFNSNGGSNVSTITVNSGGTITLPSNPTKTGYTFEGWYTESGLSNKFSTTNVINNNITLYAKWKSNAIAVTSISLNKTDFSGNVGDTTTLTVTINPSNATDKSYTYTSSNTSIATVDSSGKIVIKAAGKATITAKSTNGSKTATCSVNGTEQKSIISAGSYVIKKYNENYAIDVANGATANGSKTWTYITNSTAAQVWNIVNGSGYSTIYAGIAPGKALDVLRNGATPVAGHVIDIWTDDDPLAQRWIFTKLSNGSYAIRLSSNTNLAISSPSGQGDVKLAVYDPNDSKQMWTFSKIEVQTNFWQWPINNPQINDVAHNVGDFACVHTANHVGYDLNPGDYNVLAAATGTVVEAGYNYWAGNFVILQHVYGGVTYYTKYQHLASYSVSKGAAVSKGQKIAVVGSTGDSTGAHLHFEIATTWSNSATLTNQVRPEQLLPSGVARYTRTDWNYLVNRGYIRSGYTYASIWSEQ